MHVVPSPSDEQCNPVQFPYDAAKVRVNLWSNRVGDSGPALVSRKYNMCQEIGICVGHSFAPPGLLPHHILRSHGVPPWATLFRPLRGLDLEL